MSLFNKRSHNKDHHIIKVFVISMFLFSVPCYLHSQADRSDLRTEDRVRILEAMKIFNECGNAIWKGWSDAPFAILLVAGENEYLINHQNPSEEFEFYGYDSAIGSGIYKRAGLFGKNMLATFPAVGGISTIVVGLPENTNLSWWDWIITVLHEHFHQYQNTQSDYYSSVNSLDLSGGDETGMWMLNYKFPYHNKEVSDQYAALTGAAKKAYLSVNGSDFESDLNTYKNERDKFRKLLDKKDYDYFSFQIWQEGLARYTEIKIAECISNSYSPSDEIARLDDYVTPDSMNVKIINKLLMRADSQILSEDERVCFYTLGALEGLLLDKVNPGWRDKYLKEKFYVENYF